MNRITFFSFAICLLCSISINAQSYAGNCPSDKQAQNCNTLLAVSIDNNGDIIVDWTIGGPGGEVQNSSLQIESVWVQTNGTGPWVEQPGYANTCIQDIKAAGGGADNSSGILTLAGSFNTDDEVYIFYDAWTNPMCDGSCCGWNTASTPGAILPVVYSDISIGVDDGVIIEWTSSVEINNDYYAIERSRDGKSFIEIGQIEGSGNSISEISYAFWDPRPYTGKSYYRIVQYDYDGTANISDILPVKYLDRLDKVYFDAVNQEVMINNKLQNTSFVLYTINGEVITSGRLTEGINRIPSHNIPNGIFIASIIGQTTQNFKLLKY